MSKEIKLKAFNHIVGRFSGPYTIEQLHKEKILFTNVVFIEPTGVLDMSGVEIYNTDVVMLGSKPHEVVFLDGAYYLKFGVSHIRLSRTLGPIKIVDNVLQNPKLKQ